MQSKVFRLFISSTFSDFTKEREILQNKVFKEIREYAAKKGYTFQPIDLRWGIEQEAQLDQKTLKLCLDEVRACKTHIHPNFLIMLGDRYGWIPLPYTIEKDEFKEILLHVKSDKELLKKWYELDTNQIPSSYILKDRTDRYKEYDIWKEVEDILRDILQKAVNLSNLDEEQKIKYFLSATEAEAEEGIIPYIKPTKFQKEVLLKENENLLHIDPQYIFGFFRDTERERRKSIYIDKDYDKAQEFKQRVKETLMEENILHIQTKQIDEKSLDRAYLKEFRENIINFLKFKIDTQKKKELTIQQTQLEIEKEAQDYFSKQKRRDFIGQENSLATIKEYIEDENQKTFVVYGKSGSGKSALMSKAIEESKKNLNKKVIYRFIGATPESSYSINMLKSIFGELGVDIRNETGKRRGVKEDDYHFKNLQEEQESFEEFSLRVQNEFLKLKEDIVIFIDGLDQLQNKDKFIWLPRELPKNLKIVTSTLKDENYKEDSIYLENLKTRTDIVYKLPDFENGRAKELLNALLKKEDRRVDWYQEEYFLSRFQNTRTPLYATIATREMKSWKSGDKSQTLAKIQREITKEYIANLYKLYYHNKEFINRVLGYIYASKYGLSESELLQLLSQDEKFIEKIAPETYHKNTTKELPLVHWSRLQSELKPFLSTRKKDDEELIYFFHREFEDAIKNNPNQKAEHEAIAKDIQKLILKNQDKKFNANRWGKLYVIILAEHELRYENEKRYEEFAEFLANTKIKKEWQDKCYRYINNVAIYHINRMRIKESIAYLKINYFFIKHLYKNNSNVWAQYYIISLNNLAYSSYVSNDQPKEAIELQEEALDISEKLYHQNPSDWTEAYTRSLNNLAYSYKNNNKPKEAIELQEEALDISEKLYHQNPSDWTEAYTTSLNNLAVSYQNRDQLKEAIRLHIKASRILKLLYEKNPEVWAKLYTRSLINLAMSYKDNSQIKEAITLQEKALKILKPLYEKKPEMGVEYYTTSLNNLASFYLENKQIEKSIELFTETLDILKSLFEKDPSIWAEDYTRSLNNLAGSYLDNNQLDEAIELEGKVLDAIIPLYKKNPNAYVKIYTIMLFNVASALYNYFNDTKQTFECLKLAYKESSKTLGEEHSHTKQMKKNYLYVKDELEKSSVGTKIEKKPKGNDPCPCGSGKKHKECCGKSGPKKGVFA